MEDGVSVSISEISFVVRVDEPKGLEDFHRTEER